jgi:predicted DNA-binding transcriptional regulator YafY
LIIMPEKSDVWIDYTNHRGERAWRRIAPIELRFGQTEYHPEWQWLLDAIDVSKGQARTFAMDDIHATRRRQIHDLVLSRRTV